MAAACNAQSANLTDKEALTKRQELVELGYCVIPGVLGGELLSAWRAYEADLFARRAVDPKYRYQGSDFHVCGEKLAAGGKGGHCVEVSPIVDELIELPAAVDACRPMGLENQRADGLVIILSKPPFAPPLYWHQDLMTWNHPEAATPWPTRIFLSYYLTDTTPENGCLRAIPGTHRRRIPLHDQLPAAHGPEIQALTDLTHPAFMNHPDAVDLPVKAGDLVINDARLLHGAHANNTDERRTLVLQWHNVFDFPNPPSWWTGDVPDVIRNYDPTIEYEPTRVPGEHLKT